MCPALMYGVRSVKVSSQKLKLGTQSEGLKITSG